MHSCGRSGSGVGKLSSPAVATDRCSEYGQTEQANKATKASASRHGGYAEGTVQRQHASLVTVSTTATGPRRSSSPHMHISTSSHTPPSSLAAAGPASSTIARASFTAAAASHTAAMRAATAAGGGALSAGGGSTHLASAHPHRYAAGGKALAPHGGGDMIRAGVAGSISAGANRMRAALSAHERAPSPGGSSPGRR
jgi:hypothetical protein